MSKPSLRDVRAQTFLPPIAIVVIVVLVPFAVPVAIMIMIPVVVVIEVTAPRLPIPFEVPAVHPVRLDPIGFRGRRTRPVPIVPVPTPVVREPIALNPHVRGTG